MLLFSMLIGLHVAAWAQPVPLQTRIDAAFHEILKTDVGHAICHDILGAKPEALSFNLGVSAAAAQELAVGCQAAGPAVSWIFPTDPSDIRKLTLTTSQPRHYEIMAAQSSFPIESWTDPFTNTTYLLQPAEGLSQSQLIRLLAHETAVYFDSKADPSHPDAQSLPVLHNLKLNGPLGMNPLIAATDPLVAHTLTFVRALQVEAAIARQLNLPPDPDASLIQALVSGQCQEACLEKLIQQMRQMYLPISLPLLAFAPHFRSQVLPELVRLHPGWSSDQWARAERALNELPIDFLRHQFTGNPASDMQRVFLRDENSRPVFETARQFLADDLWPLEKPALTQTRVNRTQTLLEFLKVPLLSGYNISLSSGPRVRIRTGNAE